jgi:putative membrane protein
MGTYVKTIVLMIVLLLFVTFGVKNSQPIQLTYYFNWLDLTLPLYAIIYSLLIAGLILGMLIGLGSRLRFRKKIKDLENDIYELKEKIIDHKETRKEGVENHLRQT